MCGILAVCTLAILNKGNTTFIKYGDLSMSDLKVVCYSVSCCEHNRHQESYVEPLLMHLMTNCSKLLSYFIVLLYYVLYMYCMYYFTAAALA